MKKISLLIIFVVLSCTACSIIGDKTKEEEPKEINTQDTAAQKDEENKDEENKPSKEDEAAKEMISKVKDFILNGQQDIPEAKKIKWSKNFLNNVDFDSLYNKYIKQGGNKDDVSKFAQYITKNAPIQSDWKKTFEAELLQDYGEEVSKYKSLGGDKYQAYAIVNNKEVPFVVVNSRTGYYHG